MPPPQDQTGRNARDIIKSLDTMLERNEDFCCAKVCCRHAGLASRRAAHSKCDHHRVRGYAPRPCSRTRCRAARGGRDTDIGGRITPGFLEELGLRGRIGQVAGENSRRRRGVHLIVLQHTACGITRLTAIRNCRPVILKYLRANSRANRSRMTWGPGLSKSSYRQRRSARAKLQVPQAEPEVLPSTLLDDRR